MIDRETVQAIYWASENAGDDDYRKHLQCVRLLPIDKGVRITATNGHVLSDVEIEDEKFREILGSEAAFVMPESFPVLKAMLDEWPNIHSFGAWPIEGVDPNDADAPCIRLGEQSIGITIYRKANGGEKFPDVDGIAPADRPGQKKVVAFDVTYLLRTAQLALSEGDSRPRVALEFDPDKPMDPVVIKDLRGKRIGVIMPCRSSS